MSNPWFRLYSRIMTDPKIEMLSFEDQRHFVWILCMKNEGYLDEGFAHIDLLDRMVARKLGLQREAFENAKRRLIEVGLIDGNWQPTSWDHLQFKSDSDPTARERKRRQRERDKQNKQQENSNIDASRVKSRVIDTQITRTDPDPDPDTDTDTEYGSNSDSGFLEPSFEDLRDFLAELGGKVDPEHFMNHFKGTGWQVGKSPMQDWRAVARNWHNKGWGAYKVKPPRPPLVTKADRKPKPTLASAEQKEAIMSGIRGALAKQ